MGALEPLKIRRATAGDAERLRDHNCAMARETEGLSLDPAVVLAGVRAVLDDPGKGLYLVAERGGEVVGQLMVTYEWSDWRDGRQYWIQSVYVRPEARRGGVYRALYTHLLALARGEGAVGVRLYVHRDNAVAARTYEALGMAPAPYRLFEVDFVIDREGSG